MRKKAARRGAPIHPPGAAARRADESGERPGALPIYIQEIIERLNRLFGEATSIKDRVAFVNQVAAVIRENPVVMAQIEKNTKDQAMKGNLPGAV